MGAAGLPLGDPLASTALTTLMPSITAEDSGHEKLVATVTVNTCVPQTSLRISTATKRVSGKTSIQTRMTKKS